MAEISQDNVSKNIRDMFNKGFRAFELGNLDYAIDLLTTCVETVPSFSQARKFLRAAEVQKFKQAKHSSFGQKLASLRAGPAYFRTMSLLKSGKFDKALASAERLLRDDPLSPKHVLAFAEAAEGMKLSDAAIQTLEIARDHNQGDTSILIGLGHLYLKTGQTKTAQDCFEKVIELDPHNPAVIKALKDAMALDSMKKDGWTDAAEKGDSFHKMLKDTDEATVLEKRAKAVKSDKDVDALITDTEAKIAAEPGNINYFRELARLYAQKKMYSQSIDILDKAREINSRDPELDRTRASIKMQEYDDDIARLRQGGQNDKADEKETAKLQFMFDDVQERVKRYPNDLRLRYEWGVMLFDNEYLNEAIQQFQRAEHSLKDRQMTLYYLALCFKKKGQYDLAMEQLQKAASELGTMTDTKKEILYEQGIISELTGDKAAAANYFKQVYQVDIGFKDVARKVESGYGQGAG